MTKLKVNPELVRSDWHYNMIDLKIGQVTVRQYNLPVQLDGFLNRDLTRPADITVCRSTNLLFLPLCTISITCFTSPSSILLKQPQSLRMNILLRLLPSALRTIRNASKLKTFWIHVIPEIDLSIWSNRKIISWSWQCQLALKFHIWLRFLCHFELYIVSQNQNLFIQMSRFWSWLVVYVSR